MKTFRLVFHDEKKFQQKSGGGSFSENLLFNKADLPDAKPNDILELSQNINNETLKLLIKVRDEGQDAQSSLLKDTISLLKILGKKSEMKSSTDVNVKILSPEEVESISLQHVELIFKDQYYSRSDMLRMRSNLMNEILYHEQKIELLEMKAQVEELWCDGIRVSCGFITKETRVSFRSSTAQVHIFIQMSCEMWLFDDYGQLYLEKAVDGYLCDLFNLWKEKGCAHDVSITLFSRKFYDAKSIDGFPEYMRECIREDYMGRFYEDYYRVVVQNERYEDWFKSIGALKAIFTTYDDNIFHFHEKYGPSKSLPLNDSTWNPRAAMGIRSVEKNIGDMGEKSSVEDDQGEVLKPRMDRPRRKSLNIVGTSQLPPAAWNSTASEGNLLEVINMALNVYEKFYMDRCFERTGKMSIVISPGIGVFDVNRDMMNITKQRSIDIGSCCDLVCLGQRPLFAVPLFKINQDRSHYSDGLVDDDYNVPHWLNLSYYASRVQMECQIQGRTMLNADLLEAIAACSTGTHKSYHNGYGSSPLENERQCESSHLRKVQGHMPIIDYEDYDSKVFKYHCRAEQQDKFSYLLHRSTRTAYGERRERVSYTIATNGLFADQLQSKKSTNVPIDIKRSEETADEFLSHSFSGKLSEEEGHSAHCKRMAGSVTFPYNHYRRHGHLTQNKLSNIRSTTKALVNPFVPSRLNFKATSNRRRWAHVYLIKPNSFSNSNTQQHSKLSITKGNASPSRESLFSDSSNAQQLVITSAPKFLQPRQHHLSECSEQGFNPGSYIESPSKGHLRYDSLCLADPASNIFAKQFPHTESSSSLASSCNDIFGSLGRSRSANSTRLHQQVSRHSQLPDKDAVCHACKMAEFDPLLPVYAGIDWKSMTIPPILPITTDYFPDKQTLEQHYLFSEYTLVAEEIEAHFSGVYGSRHTPTLREVFNEMIYQRVAQGFQIIILPKPTQQPQQSSRKQAFHKSTSIPATPSITEEVIMSMGRLFHKLTLHEKDIVVRRYNPRHCLTQQGSYDYTYRFQVPDSFYFDSSLTCFKTDPLDTYNWNYVDHHLLAQGGEAQFLETMKFWRSRFMLMPGNNPGSKKIQEGSEVSNVYRPKDPNEKQSLIEGFLKFIEYINGIKRVYHPTCKKKERRGSLVLGINICIDKSQRHESGEIGSNSQPGYSYNNGDSFAENQLLRTHNYQYSLTTPHTEVLKAMLDPNNGLTLVKSQQDWITLPQNSFIASDAVFWLIKYVGGISSVNGAVSYMQQLIDEHHICHASGKQTVPFVFGFKIFDIVSDGHKKDNTQTNSLYLMEQNLVEIEILTGVEEENQARRRNTQPASALRDRKLNKPLGLTTNIFNQAQFKHVRLEVDGKSERQEWGILRHHQLYTPTCAFEMSIEWLVATGSILGEQIFGWARKASTCSLHLIPVPADPFALPFVKQSDPLRGPIYIPLDVDCLEGREWSSKINHSSLLNFQDLIIKSFGFMRDKCVTALTLSEDYFLSKHDELPKYIHCTGGMHIMVVSTLSRRAETGRADPHGNKATLDQYEDFVIRQYNKQMAQGKGSKPGSTHTVGFLWAWNFMLTKKWTYQQTGNDVFQDRILSDMRRFCSNSNNRLKTAWDHFKKSKDNIMFPVPN